MTHTQQESSQDQSGSSDHSIILVGCDKDLLFDTRHLSSRVLGYTAKQRRADIPYNYLGEVQSLRIEEKNVRLLVTVDDIALRKWILTQFPDRLFTYVSPRATVSPDATISAGTVIQSGCFISSGCSVSTLVKVNVGCQIHHDSSVLACSVLAPGVTLLGHTKIGQGSYIGSRVVIREKTSVGDNCFIGMGSVVVKSIPRDTLAYGNPCRTKPTPQLP